MKPSSSLNKQQKALLFAGGLSLILMFIPGARFALLPLTYLNTHLHELMHALAAVGTGGEAEKILVFGNGEGVTPVRGGFLLLVASAGYLGAIALGASIIAACKTGDQARWIARGLSVILALSMLIWVRGDLVGIVSGIFWVGVLWVIQGLKDPLHRVFAVQFIGVQQCLNAAGSLRDLVLLTSRSHSQNDAGLIQRFTGIPPLFTAVVWGIMGVAATFLACRYVFSRSQS